MNNLDQKTQTFSQKLEKKLRIIPIVGEPLATLATLFSLIGQYKKKEYADFPLGAIIAIFIVAYSIYPLDILPDALLGIGQIDDIGVVLACWNLIKSDVEDYRKWREL